MWFSRDSAIDVRFASIDRCKLLLAVKYKMDKAEELGNFEKVAELAVELF